MSRSDVSAMGTTKTKHQNPHYPIANLVATPNVMNQARKILLRTTTSHVAVVPKVKSHSSCGSAANNKVAT